MLRSTYRIVVAVAGLALATGCAAGQVSQTNTQTSTVDGATADVGDIALRDISFEFPDSGEYSSGDSARLQFYAVNGDPGQADALVDVSSPAFEGDLDSDDGVPIDIPAGGSVSFREDGLVLQLTDLAERLRPSAQVDVTFVFENAGEVTVRVPVGVPLDYAEPEVEPYDFHQEEETVTEEE